MTHEEAEKKARELLARGRRIAGIYRANDPVGDVLPERVEELTRLILTDAVDADACLAEVR